MPSAYIKVLPRPPYHGDVIARTLARMGYSIAGGPEPRPKPADLIVLWNRYLRDEPLAQRYEAAGARVVVVENGYFGRNLNGREWYAMSIGDHNGAGRMPPPSAERWVRLGIEVKPWRTDGRELVILAQRGMGSERTKQPNGWPQKIAAELRRRTKRPVRIRDHPGPQFAIPAVSLADDLSDAWAAVTWASGAGLKALALGCPVFCGFPHWIGAAASLPVSWDLEKRYLRSRDDVFHQIASGMWSLPEIESGEAFECLLT